MLQAQVDGLVADPCLSNFQSVLMLINFGFVLVKLAPKEYTPKLHVLSAHLQATCQLGFNKLPKWNEEIGLSELFKFPVTVRNELSFFLFHW